MALPAQDLQAVGSVGELLGELLLGSMESRDTHASVVEVPALPFLRSGNASGYFE